MRPGLPGRANRPFERNLQLLKEKTIYNSNIINNVRYTTKDTNGNEYTITALKGQIDVDSPNILYLTDVEALIKLANSESINIKSNFGKYLNLQGGTPYPPLVSATI